MSRVAKKPVEIPKGVEVKIDGQTVTAKGAAGNDSVVIHDTVAIKQEDGSIGVEAAVGGKSAVAMAGTMRSLLANLVVGVSAGFEKKLELRGVGYRAQAQGNSIKLGVGYSHPVVHKVPDGIKIETPSQTEIVIKGFNKQVVGQVAADIRSYRPPEPYKGKGIRYVDEYVAMKEAKKK